MSANSKLKKSRDQWKNKAVSRAGNVRYLNKELARVKTQRDKLKKQLRQAQQALEQVSANTPALISKCDLIWIALQLFGLARLGFRAISRVLAVLAPMLGIAKAPCPQTVINWVTRLSIARIQHAAETIKAMQSKGWIAIVDASIAMGSGKLMVLLAIRADHYQYFCAAPTLQTVSCLGVSVAVSWTGQSVAQMLESIIDVVGRPVAVIKDGGTDLAKAMRLLIQQGLDIHSIDDLSHVVANLLKHQYQNHPMFATFLSACAKASKRFKQTILACLAPPKVSTKARFMNLHRLVVWADRILRHSPTGRAANGSLVQRLRDCFDQLPQCKAFIAQFLRDAGVLLQCQQILKAKGLSIDTFEQCLALLQQIPSNSPVYKGFLDWMQRHLQIARALGLEVIGMPISSDILESLFGVLKQLVAGQIKDVNHIGLKAPALCGPMTPQDAQRVLDVSVDQQKEATGNINSLIRQRCQILAHPGKLTDRVLADGDNLELLPGSKNRSKIGEIDIISDG